MDFCELTDEAKTKLVKWYNSKASERYQLANRQALFDEVLEKTVGLRAVIEIPSHQSKSGQVETYTLFPDDYDYDTEWVNSYHNMYS